MANGNTVVSTHALMEYWDELFLENVQFHKYELVIDESLSHVLEPIKIASRDIQLFLEDKRLIVQKENKYSRLTVSKEDRSESTRLNSSHSQQSRMPSSA